MISLKPLISHSGVRYVLIGGFVYLIELSSILVLKYIGFDSIVSVAISFWLGLVLSFVAQKYITFNDKRSKGSIVLSQVVAVSLLVLFNFGFTLMFTHFTAGFMSLVISRTIALIFTTVWNYYFYKNHIFRVKIAVID